MTAMPLSGFQYKTRIITINYMANCNISTIHKIDLSLDILVSKMTGDATPNDGLCKAGAWCCLTTALTLGPSLAYDDDRDLLFHFLGSDTEELHDRERRRFLDLLGVLDVERDLEIYRSFLRP